MAPRLKELWLVLISYFQHKLLTSRCWSPSRAWSSAPSRTTTSRASSAAMALLKVNSSKPISTLLIRLLLQEMRSQTDTMRKFSRIHLSLPSWARWSQVRGNNQTLSIIFLSPQLSSPPEGFEEAVKAHFYLKRESLIKVMTLYEYMSTKNFDWWTPFPSSMPTSRPPIVSSFKELETQMELYKSKEARKLVAEVNRIKFHVITTV